MEAKMEQLPATNENPVLSVDKHGCVLNSNEAGITLLNEWSVRVGEKLPSSIGDIVQRVFSRNSPEKIEVKIGNKTYLIVFSPLPEQELVSISGFDISDHRELGEETQQSEERLKALMDHNPSLIFMKDECGRYVYLNDSYEKQFIHSKDWYGKTDFDFWPKESAELFRANDSLVLKSGRTHQFMEDSTDMNGTRYCWLNYKFPFTDSKNKKYVGGIGIDATYRVRSEEALQESEERYRMLFTNMTEGFVLVEVIYNEDGTPCDYRYLEMNPTYELSTGIKKEKALGKPIKESFPNINPMVIEKLREVEHSGRSTNFEIFNQVTNRYFDIYMFIPQKGKIAGVFKDVTERKQAEKILQESEIRFRALAENSPDIITRFDKQYRYLYANPAAVEFYDISLDEIIGKTYDEGVTSKKVKLWEGYLESTFVTGKTKTLEHYYISPQGDKYYFNTKIVPEFVDGKVVSVLAISRDITDIKETETKLKEILDNLENLVKERTAELEKAYKSLKESEKSLAEAQEMAHIGNWEQNFANNKLHWSDELYRIFGFKPQEFEMNYSLFLNYVHPDDQNKIDNAFKGAFNGKPFDTTYRIILANGEERIAHSKGDIVFDEKNNPVRIRGTAQDITESRRAEERLRQSEEKYRNIVETANEGISINDGEGIITFVNKKMADITGYNIDEIIGKKIWDFVGKEDQYAVMVNWEKRRRGFNASFDLKLTRKDGSPMWVYINSKPFFDDNSRFMGSLNMHTDITKRKEVEEALRNFEIARKKEIHHRIKNNLQVISSLLDLEADFFKGRKDILDSEVLNAFKQSIDRVLSIALIHEELYKGNNIDLLNFSQYIRKLAENLLQTNKLNIDVNLNFDLEANVFLDMDTAIPLGIIINELATNSFKYAFSGRDTGEMRIRFHREENVECKIESNNRTSYVLSVSDNGVGIPADLDIENLDSLGLQLIIILVEQLDGELELKRDNGTEFIIRFTVTEKDNQVSAPQLSL